MTHAIETLNGARLLRGDYGYDIEFHPDGALTLWNRERWESKTLAADEVSALAQGAHYRERRFFADGQEVARDSAAWDIAPMRYLDGVLPAALLRPQSKDWES